jgi:hypothetical protein
LLISWLCSACLASSGGSPEENRPSVENPPASSQPSVENPPTSSQPSLENSPASGQPTVENSPASSQPTPEPQPQQETLAFGKSHRWHDGVTATVGKPQKFKPSEFAVVQKSKRYVKFPVTVVNKSHKSIDLGLTYISVKSANKEADHVFDSLIGLKGPPDKKVLKGRKVEFHVGFAVLDPKDIVMELALHDDSDRSSLLYST